MGGSVAVGRGPYCPSSLDAIDEALSRDFEDDALDGNPFVELHVSAWAYPLVTLSVPCLAN